MEANQEQIEALQEQYQGSAVMEKVMAAFSRYQNAVQDVPVDRVWARVGKAVKRSEVVGTLKQLEALGFGRYIKGAHGHASRFVFERGSGPKHLSLLARGELADDATEAEDYALDEGDFDRDDGDEVTHCLRLREDFDVEIRLPADLTFKEAKRLSLWLRSIPLDSDGDEF